MASEFSHMAVSSKRTDGFFRNGSNSTHLDGLSEAHLVREDSVELAFVQRDQPVEANVLP
jgi:hypothetical protein